MESEAGELYKTLQGFNDRASPHSSKSALSCFYQSLLFIYFFSSNGRTALITTNYLHFITCKEIPCEWVDLRERCHLQQGHSPAEEGSLGRDGEPQPRWLHFLQEQPEGDARVSPELRLTRPRLLEPTAGTSLRRPPVKNQPWGALRPSAQSHAAPRTTTAAGRRVRVVQVHFILRSPCVGKTLMPAQPQAERISRHVYRNHERRIRY